MNRSTEQQTSATHGAVVLQPLFFSIFWGISLNLLTFLLFYCIIVQETRYKNAENKAWMREICLSLIRLQAIIFNQRRYKNEKNNFNIIIFSVYYLIFCISPGAVSSVRLVDRRLLCVCSIYSEYYYLLLFY